MRDSHSPAGASRGRLAIVLVLSSSIFVAELVTALLSNSLSLLTDAAHVLTDVLGVGLALAAIWFAARPATARRTYGFYRLEILAAIANAAVLLGIALVVLIEAVRRFSSTPEIQTAPMLVVAAIGLLGNLVSAAILRDAAQRSVNMRGAYLEVVADALGSAAVIVAALVIALTGFRAADAIASVLIGLLIVPRTWSLLREALDVLMESTPKDLQMEHVREHILDAPGVTSVHDLHVWTITSGMNVISAHVVVDQSADRARVLSDLARCLSDDFDIEHSTFQIEGPDHRDPAESVHA